MKTQINHNVRYLSKTEESSVRLSTLASEQIGFDALSVFARETWPP